MEEYINRVGPLWRNTLPELGHYGGIHYQSWATMEE